MIEVDDRFPDDMTLGEVRAWLNEQIPHKGARCPCCGRFSRIYRRTLYGAMAVGLIAAYQRYHREWFHMRVATRYAGGDHSKLRYWGLIEEQSERRPDGGKAGWWRITDNGVAFVLGTWVVPRDAYVYNSKCLRLDDSRGLITIRDALGRKFDYGELMGSGSFPWDQWTSGGEEDRP